VAQRASKHGATRLQPEAPSLASLSKKVLTPVCKTQDRARQLTRADKHAGTCVRSQTHTQSHVNRTHRHVNARETDPEIQQKLERSSRMHALAQSLTIAHSHHTRGIYSTRTHAGTHTLAQALCVCLERAKLDITVNEGRCIRLFRVVLNLDSSRSSKHRTSLGYSCCGPLFVRQMGTLALEVSELRAEAKDLKAELTLLAAQSSLKPERSLTAEGTPPQSSLTDLTHRTKAIEVTLPPLPPSPSLPSGSRPPALPPVLSVALRLWSQYRTLKDGRSPPACDASPPKHSSRRIDQ
jgi:hypothetical protein